MGFCPQVVTEKLAISKGLKNEKQQESTGYNLASKLLKNYRLSLPDGATNRTAYWGDAMGEDRMTGNKVALLGGALVLASAAGLAPHFWAAATLLLGGVGIVSLSAYDLHRHRVSRRARNIAKPRFAQPCSLHLVEEQVPLYAKIDSLERGRGVGAIGFQSGRPEGAVRRGFSEHPYVRKVPVRRPETLRKRHHLMEWGHR
jgi:hypothetical protein